MKLTLLLAILISISIQIFGQQKSMNLDTLIINIENKVIIKTTVYECAWLRGIDNYPGIINEFKSKIKLIKQDIPIDKAYKLIYTGNKEIIVETKADKVYYKLNNGLEKYQITECVINSEYFDIYIEFNDLDTFLDLDIVDCIKQVINHEICSDVGDFATKKHHGIAWRWSYKCENDSVSFVPEKSHWTGHKSMLEIIPNIGTGIIQNDLVTDISFRLGRIGTNKGILKKHQYISYNLLYVFNQDNTLQLNHFLNIGFRFNSLNSLQMYKWRGFELGYLISSQGEYFKTPTFRLATMIDLKHNITLSPQIYFDDGFKKVYPGLRLGIGIINW